MGSLLNTICWRPWGVPNPKSKKDPGKAVGSHYRNSVGSFLIF